MEADTKSMEVLKRKEHAEALKNDILRKKSQARRRVAHEKEED
jgi:hypothetical protein